MVTRIDKFLVSLLPLVTIAGGWIGADVSPEWWNAVVAAATPVLVYAFPNKP